MARRRLPKRLNSTPWMTAALAGLLVTGGIVQGSDVQAPMSFDGEGGTHTLKRLDGVVALQYPATTPAADVEKRGAADCLGLDAEMVQTILSARQVLVRGTESEMRLRLASRARNGGPIEVRPVYAVDGVEQRLYLVTIPQRLTVAFEDGVTGDVQEALLRRYGLTRYLTIARGFFSTSTEVANAEIPALARRMEQENPGVVKFAEPVFSRAYRLHTSNALDLGNDPLFPLQWYLVNTNFNTVPYLKTLDEDTDVPRAWQIAHTGSAPGGSFPTYGSCSISVAVFDTGTEVDHEDFIHAADDYCDSDPISSPQRGTSLYPGLGTDVVDSDSMPVPGASAAAAHGTAVAGIIAAARNNGVGIIGVAPDVKIYTVRLFASDVTVDSDKLAAALTQTSQKGIDIANHSYGTPVSTTTEKNAYFTAFDVGRPTADENLHMVQIASAGNTSGTPEYPGLYRSTFAVGAVEEEGLTTSYSGRGGRLDFVAPSIGGGTGIWTMDTVSSRGVAGPDGFDPNDTTGNWAEWTGVRTDERAFGGTSLAAPQVSGIVALLLSKDPGQTVREVMSVLAATADRTPNQLLYSFPTEGGADSLRVNDFWRKKGTNNVDDTTKELNIDGDGFSPFLGYGRPNAAAAVVMDFAASPFRPTSLAAPPAYTSDFRLQYQNSLHYNPDDPESIPSDIEFDGEATWEVRQQETGDGSAYSDDILLREDGGFIQSPGTLSSDPHDDSTFPIITLADGPNTTATLTSDGGEFNNPEFRPGGRYPAGADSAAIIGNIPLSGMTGVNRGYLEIDIMHELGTQNASSVAGSVSTELDYVTVTLTPGSEGPDGFTPSSSDPAQLLLQLTGDTSNTPKQELVASAGTDPNTGTAVWTNTYYSPLLPPSSLFFRTYRVPLAKIASSSIGQLEVRIQAGASYLPTYDRLTAPTPDDPPAVQQMATHLDYAGFEVAQVRLYKATDAELKKLFPAELFYARGAELPVYSASGKDVFMVERRQESSTVVQDYIDFQKSDPLTQTKWNPNNEYNYTTGYSLTHNGAHTFINSYDQRQVAGLDASPITSQLVYAASNGGATDTHLYLVEDDGFNERELPVTLAGVRHVAFAPTGQAIVYNNQQEARRLSLASNIEERLITAGDLDLGAIDGVVMDGSNGYPIFTGEALEDGGWDLYAAPLVGGRRVPRLFKLLDWPSTDETEPTISNSGTRLAFTSNRTAQGDAAPSSNTKIYFIDNLRNVVEFGTTPKIKEMSLKRDFTTPSISDRFGSVSFPTNTNYTSARSGRFSPDDSKLLFIGLYSATADALGRYEVARGAVPVQEDPNVPTPTPPGPYPTPTPLATPTPGGGGQVSFQGRFEFQHDAEGWLFHSIPQLVAPEGTYESGTGSLKIKATATDNVFGYWTSPMNNIRPIPVSGSAPETGDPDERNPDTYLVRAWVRCDASLPLKAPELRLRVNSTDLQEYFTQELNSTGSLVNTAVGSLAVPVDLLFQPSTKLYDLAPTYQAYTTTVDIANFGGQDEAAAYYIDRVDFYRIPPDALSTVTELRSYDFSTSQQRSEWETLGASGFTQPSLSISSTGLSALVSDPANSFGGWVTKPGIMNFDATAYPKPLIIRMTTTTYSQNNTGLKNPEVRYRLNTGDFEEASTHGLVPVGDATMTPNSADAPRYASTYLVLPKAPDITGVFAAVDFMSFGREEGSLGGRSIIVGKYQPSAAEAPLVPGVKVDLLAIQNYPAYVGP